MSKVEGQRKKKGGRAPMEDALQAHIIKWLRERGLHSVVASCVGVFSDEAMRRADTTKVTLEQLVNATLLDQSYRNGPGLRDGGKRTRSNGISDLRSRAKILSQQTVLRSQGYGKALIGPSQVSLSFLENPREEKAYDTKLRSEVQDSDLSSEDFEARQQPPTTKLNREGKKMKRSSESTDSTSKRALSPAVNTAAETYKRREKGNGSRLVDSDLSD